MILASVLLAAGVLIESVAAHGYVPQIKIGNQYIPGWNVQSDPYTTPQPLRVVRPTKPDSGFISDPSSGDITCSIGNSFLPPGPITATVAAGSDVTVLWNTWPLGHFGPVLNYLAKCPGECSSWKGDTGTPWFKFQQDVYTNGNYILRHENLALHAASNIGGAQFYPVCIQLTVTGGGSLNPSGLAFPGAYSATEPGVHFNPYQGEAANQLKRTPYASTCLSVSLRSPLRSRILSHERVLVVTDRHRDNESVQEPPPWLVLIFMQQFTVLFVKFHDLK
ncbi:hypothetical protein ONZ45_g14986 [Pleurotus djamor]|nr:hypothetical protein ONZ45_g14986 [Pleurotus djamor]